MKAKAAIFDLDGTLIDSLTGIGGTVNEVFARRGYPQHEISAYRYFAGDGVEMLIRRALPAVAREDELIQECIVDFLETYERCWRETTKTFSGIEEMLAELTARNVQLAVLSNKVDKFTKDMVRELFPRTAFGAVLGQRPGVPKKPEPDGALEITKALQVDTLETLFIGDTSVDMQTAVNAGMVPIGVLWGFRESAELREHGAYALLEEPRDLLEFISRSPR